MNINSCRVSELNKHNKSKFVAKLLDYRILLKDIPILLGHDYRDASLITLDLVVIGISIPKIR